jgi:hypothetical protein
MSVCFCLRVRKKSTKKRKQPYFFNTIQRFQPLQVKIATADDEHDLISQILKASPHARIRRQIGNNQIVERNAQIRRQTKLMRLRNEIDVFIDVFNLHKQRIFHPPMHMIRRQIGINEMVTRHAQIRHQIESNEIEEQNRRLLTYAMLLLHQTGCTSYVTR